MDEEVVLLEEQLASAHADIEQLQVRLTESEVRVTRLELELAEAQRPLEEARQALMESQARLVAADEEAKQVAQRYREVVLAGEPNLPVDLVSGQTVDEIDQAVQRARETVARVRQHLEQQAQALRIPTGAPPRSAFDPSGLSATEKIRLGLSQT